MGAAIQLRSDYTADDLHRLARASRDAKQTRRLLALASIYEGGSRSQAARIGGVGLQIIRDWVVRFNAHGPDGLLDCKAPGKTPRLSDAQRAALAQAVEAGPQPYLDGVVRWRLVDLVQWLREEFGVSLSRHTVSRELRAMGFVAPRRPLASQSSRPAPAIMRKTLRSLRHLKKLRRQAGGDPSATRAGNANRNLVPGRGQDWTEEQDHPPLGAAWKPAACAA